MDSPILISTNEFNNKAFRIWNAYSDSVKHDRVPLTYPPLIKNALLFVGLNPSFSLKAYASFLKGTKFVNFDPVSFFDWENRKNFDFEIAREIEEYSKSNYSYFSKFRRIAEDIGIPWEHIDLFLIRETNQKRVLQFIYEKPGRLNNFAQEQILLAEEITAKIQPQIIVVANALASKIVFEAFGLKFNSRLGCHIYESEQRQIPVFLTSMLTGQRALDNFSFLRLQWHVREVLNRLK